MPEPSTLAEAFTRFGSYPDDHPQTLRALVDADPDQITHPLAWFLRAQVIGAQRAAERHHIHTPKDALKLLKNNYVLHPWTGAWSTYALSEERQVVMVPHEKGGTQPLRKHTRLLPKVADLPPLPRGDARTSKRPAWLVIFGGDPAVLSKPGVAKGLATLQRQIDVADILFWDSGKESGTPPTLWSLRAGRGMQDTGAPGGRRVDFPDADALNEPRRFA